MSGKQEWWLHAIVALISQEQYYLSSAYLPACWTISLVTAGRDDLIRVIMSDKFFFGGVRFYQSTMYNVLVYLH